MNGPLAGTQKHEICRVAFGGHLFYHLQTRFEEVMFSQCLSVHGGASASSPRGVSAHAGVADILPGQTPPPHRQTHVPWADSQQAAGTHPTGMHSCLNLFLNHLPGVA